jgi:hypothetical protein
LNTAFVNSSNTLRLYGTDACHLCDMAKALLLPWVAEGWSVELIDIAEDDVLLEVFASLIPVLECVDGTQLRWPFSESDVHCFLNKYNNLEEAVP